VRVSKRRFHGLVRPSSSRREWSPQETQRALLRLRPWHRG
jgi:hypothetical protein